MDMSLQSASVSWGIVGDGGRCLESRPRLRICWWRFLSAITESASLPGMGVASPGGPGAADDSALKRSPSRPGSWHPRNSRLKVRAWPMQPPSQARLCVWGWVGRVTAGEAPGSGCLLALPPGSVWPVWSRTLLVCLCVRECREIRPCTQRRADFPHSHTPGDSPC